MLIIILLILLCLLAIITIILLLRPKNNSEIIALQSRVEALESRILDNMRLNRNETLNTSREDRQELNNTLKDFRSEITTTLKNLTEALGKNIDTFNNQQRERFAQLETRQNRLVESTEKKLEEMRATVDEKLQKTLNERIGASFEIVGRQLENVQKGLGEMQTLAQDVGGLKKVLSNVKMRGGLGEVQLSLLLEQILAPDQYEANVRTKHGSLETVEFAIKLPNKGDGNSMYIPIDAKFPKDIYEQLQDAYDHGDPVQIETAQRNLENTVRKMAKDISDKYIDPPNTTDFALLFLPFEGIYAEIIRKASFIETLQREYKIIPTGPTTLAAILNSLQVGFRSLAIQKRSSEVWQVLGAVKKEFENFGGLLQKAQNNLHTASNQIDEVMGKRTRAIQRKLKGVTTLGEAETRAILPDITEGEILDDDPEP